MKKAIAFVLALIMIMSLVACGNFGKSHQENEEVAETAENLKDRARKSAERYVAIYAGLSYSVSGVPYAHVATINEISENKWKVYGKVNLKDKYGDAYSGNFDGYVTYDPESDSFDNDIDIGTRQKGD